MTAILVATAGWDPAEWVGALGGHLPDHRILATDAEGRLAGAEADLAEISYLLAWKPPQALVDRLTGLKVLFSLGAGIDHLTSLDRLPAVPIVRIVDPDLTMRMTEWVVWQVLHHHRRGFDYARQQAARLWRERPQPAARAVNVGILGSGVLGTDAARALARIGFAVATWSRTAKTIDGIENYCGEDGLPAFLARTDILVCLLPLTARTRGIVNRDMLRALRRDGPSGAPVFINAGRGGVHVESDIVRALRDGTLGGASLDVFETEPLAAESPLWALPNVVITPHASAVSNATALSRGIAEQILAYETGAPLLNRVDAARGY